MQSGHVFVFNWMCGQQLSGSCSCFAGRTCSMFHSMSCWVQSAPLVFPCPHVTVVPLALAHPCKLNRCCDVQGCRAVLGFMCTLRWYCDYLFVVVPRHCLSICWLSVAGCFCLRAHSAFARLRSLISGLSLEVVMLLCWSVSPFPCCY